jgi:hypothetical protein
MKTTKKWIAAFLLLMTLYLLTGYVLEIINDRERTPEISGHFKSGDTFRSDAEGLTQRVIRQENGIVFCDVILDPYAPGPPKHIHTGFDETFKAGEKGLFVLVDYDTLFIKPMESYTIKKGTPHKPFNPTGDTIRLSMDEWGFPEEFAFGLVQMYGFMDQKALDDRTKGEILLQLSLFSKHFDSWATENVPPPAILKVMFFFLRPAARIMGMKSYYNKFSVQRTTNN